MFEAESVEHSFHQSDSLWHDKAAIFGIIYVDIHVRKPTGNDNGLICVYCEEICSK